MDPIVMTVLAFVTGLLSFTSPCCLPLLPGYVSPASGRCLPAPSRSRRQRLRSLAARRCWRCTPSASGCRSSASPWPPSACSPSPDGLRRHARGVELAGAATSARAVRA